MLSAVVVLGACFACAEAYRSTEYGWASVFLAAALIFGTAFLVPWPDSYAIVIDFLALSLFASSVVHWRELLPERVAAKTAT